MNIKKLYHYKYQDFYNSLFTDTMIAPEDSPVHYGGELDLGTLLDAYSHGVFPWFSRPPVQWWSPDPRFVLFPENLNVSRSTKQFIKKKPYRLTLDTVFHQVIQNCKSVKRPRQGGTWITTDIVRSFIRLHRIGLAHSVEVWQEKELVGGLYGVSLGRIFFGESMFSHQPNASKLALIFLTRILEKEKFHLIDSQVYTDYLDSMGAIMIPRYVFLDTVYESLQTEKTLQGSWSEIFAHYDESILE